MQLIPVVSAFVGPRTQAEPPQPEVLQGRFVPDAACSRQRFLHAAEDYVRRKSEAERTWLHAKPYDPQARGKMERFWRTMRSRCTDHLPVGATLHDLNAALLAFLDADYHRRPHAGLLGKRPIAAFQDGLTALPRPRTAADLAQALDVTVTVKVRGDCTVSIDGRPFEVSGRHLAVRPGQ